MNQTQEQLKSELIAHRVYVDFNAANAPDVLAQDANSIHPITFNCISKIEHAIAQLALQFPEEASAAWVIDPNLGVGRSGLPIIIEPQRRDKHEFETFEHSERAAWAISQFYRTIYPKLPTDLQENEQIKELALKSLAHDKNLSDWSLAAYLHDVEKFVESRKVINTNDPSTKNEDKLAARAALLQTPEGKDYKSADIIKTLFATSDMQLDANSSPLQLQGLLQNEAVEPNHVIELFNVYKAVDRSIIEHAKAGFDKSDPQMIDFAYENICAIATSSQTQIMGILLMAADNMAQGVPPIEPPPSSAQTEISDQQKTEFIQKRNAFIAERIRNYDIVVTLLRKIVNTNKYDEYAI